jgi:hypothetical protein
MLIAVGALFVWLFKTLNLSIVGNIAAVLYIIFITQVWYRTELISEPEWLSFALFIAGLILIKLIDMGIRAAVDRREM